MFYQFFWIFLKKKKKSYFLDLFTTSWQTSNLCVQYMF